MFIHGDLQEEVYMEQPMGFVAQGRVVWYVVFIRNYMVLSNPCELGLENLVMQFNSLACIDVGLTI